MSHASFAHTAGAEKNENFDMGIDFDMNSDDILTTKADVNYDSLTGTFCLPVQSTGSEAPESFSFALDETGIVFIDQHCCPQTYPSGPG